MAGGDELMALGGGSLGGPLAALLFIGSGTNVYDAFSAVMSSPWSTEKFTKDAEEERMARQYVTHAMCLSWGYAIAGAAICWADPSTPNGVAVAPLAGALLATIYMYWLYNRALTRSLSGEGMDKAEAPDVAPAAPSGGTWGALTPWSD